MFMKLAMRLSWWTSAENDRWKWTHTEKKNKPWTMDVAWWKGTWTQCNSCSLPQFLLCLESQELWWFQPIDQQSFPQGTVAVQSIIQQIHNPKTKHLCDSSGVRKSKNQNHTNGGCVVGCSKNELRGTIVSGANVGHIWFTLHQLLCTVKENTGWMAEFTCHTFRNHRASKHQLRGQWEGSVAWCHGDKCSSEVHASSGGLGTIDTWKAKNEWK